jgi:hypothetical protein
VKNIAMTLAELIVVLALICILMVSIYSIYLIFLTSINYDVERCTVTSAVSYALSDMKVRCLSASQINDDSRFVWSGDSTSEFNFVGQGDIYNITPDDLSDDHEYSYFIRDGDLVLEDRTSDTIEILVEHKYNPSVEFKYTQGDEPNFITVSISAEGSKNFGKDTPKVNKVEGIRFWFADVVR